jgi:DNA modification methylase
MLKPYFKSDDNKFYLLHGDTFDLLPKFDFKFDMIFADPPYFLSNGGLTVENGKIVSVNKGSWDKSFGIEYVNEFNRKWLSLVRNKMKEDAIVREIFLLDEKAGIFREIFIPDLPNFGISQPLSPAQKSRFFATRETS